MNNIILFKIGEDEFPIEIVDKDNQRWVTRKQLGNALGVDNLKPLHSRLVERGELQHGIHWSNDSLPQNTKNCVTQYRDS